MRDYRQWTTEEFRHVRELRARGLTWDVIGRRLGRSAKGVQKAYARYTRNRGEEGHGEDGTRESHR